MHPIQISEPTRTRTGTRRSDRFSESRRQSKGDEFLMRGMKPRAAKITLDAHRLTRAEGRDPLVRPSPVQSPPEPYELIWRDHKPGWEPFWESLSESFYGQGDDKRAHPDALPRGYPTAGYYTPTHRLENAEDFGRRVDDCHAGGIGVICDRVPAQLPKHSIGLAGFEAIGSYARQGPQLGEQPAWMNDNRNPVQPESTDNLRDAPLGMAATSADHFTAPFPHDDIRRGERPEEASQRSANLRLLCTYLFADRGKNLPLMDYESGRTDELSSAGTPSWYMLDYALHQGIRELMQALGRLDISEPLPTGQDVDRQDAPWIEHYADQDRGVRVLRREEPDTGQHLMVVLNGTPIPHGGYRIGVPGDGPYAKLINTDDPLFGGTGIGNEAGMLIPEEVPWMNESRSVVLPLPPLAGIVLKPIATDSITRDPAVDRFVQQPTR
jgi:1,4-alpha-glucan branching enzyme